MAYWVTILAMGGVPDQAKSLLHMVIYLFIFFCFENLFIHIYLFFFKVGAIGVALAIEYDRTGVFTFLVPAVVGIFVLLASWVS